MSHPIDTIAIDDRIQLRPWRGEDLDALVRDIIVPAP